MTEPTPLSVVFLRDTRHGGPAEQLSTVADALAAFVAAATTSIDIAIYDFRLDDAAAVSAVVGSLTDAAARGVAVRIAFDAGKPAAATAETFALLQADPAPPGTAEWVHGHFDGTAVAVKPITAGGQLMHDKYVVRDGACVWTGSTNFTDDAWTLQENNIVSIDSSAVAAGFRKDFDEMWASGRITGTGKNDAGSATVGGGGLGWDFCPGDGKAVNAALAARVTSAKERLVVATMVLTSHEVLDALARAVGRDVPITGIYDGGQMDPIVRQWAANPNSAAVLADWHTVEPLLVRKNSTPYTPTSVHDFMHLKVLISDDTLTTGSYNFSANAERNAENQIHLTDPDTVVAYSTFLDAVIAEYS